MASPLQSQSISAPGFFGLNTQDSPLDLSSGFALTATNCVIDQFGRIGTRKGYTHVNPSSGNLGSNPVGVIHELVQTDGTLGQKQIFTHTLTNFDTIAYGVDAPTIVTQKGSYVVQIRLYNDYPLIDFDISAIFATNFYVATRTLVNLDQIDRNLGIIDASIGQISCTFDFPFGLDDMKCLGQYILAFFFPPYNTLSASINSLLDTFLFMSPWGYATQLYTSLQISDRTFATTTPPSISYTFPAALPASGLHIELRPLDGMDMFNSFLASSSPSYAGTYGEQLLFYWNTMWSMVFFFWLLTNLLGVFNFTKTERLTRDERQSMTVDMSSKGKFRGGTINMRND